MARSIANLAVSVVAKTTGFQKGMKGVERQFKRFKRSINSARAALRPFANALLKLGGIATAITGGGLTYLVKQSFDMLDAMAKSSRAIGTTTEQLAGLHHAAQIGGVSIQEMNKGLENLQRNYSDATRGTGEAIDAFKLLGLDPVKGVGSNLQERFEKILSASKKLSDSDAVSALRDIFGRPGAKFRNLDVESLRDAAKFAERVGLAVNSFDAGRIEAANDAITRMKATFRGIANTIAIAVAPGVQTMADAISNASASGDQMRSTVNAALESMAVGASYVASAVLNIVLAFKQVGLAGVAAIESVLRSIASMNKKLESVFGAGLFGKAGGKRLVNKRTGKPLFGFASDKEFNDFADELTRGLPELATEIDMFMIALPTRADIRARFAGLVSGLQEVASSVPELIARPVDTLIEVAEKAKERVQTLTRTGSFQSRRVGELGFSSASALASARVPLFARDNRVEFEQLTVLKKIEKNTREIDAGGLA